MDDHTHKRLLGKHEDARTRKSSQALLLAFHQHIQDSGKSPKNQGSDESSKRSTAPEASPVQSVPVVKKTKWSDIIKPHVRKPRRWALLLPVCVGSHSGTS